MLTSRHAGIPEKRDLHVGGFGGGASGTFPAVAPVADGTDGLPRSVLRSARQAATAANGYVRGNPWGVIGAVALIALAAGFLISRRP